MTIIQVALHNVPIEVKHNNNKIFPRFINSMQSLYMARFVVHMNGPCYKGEILQRNNRKMTIPQYSAFDESQTITLPLSYSAS